MKYVPLSTWAGVCCLTVALLFCAPVVAQDFEDWQVAEMQPLVTAVTAARMGEGAVGEEAVQILPSYMKGTEGNTYAPYTLILGPSLVTKPNIVTYVVMTAAGESPNADGELPAVSYEDVFYSPVSGSGAQEIRIDRAMQAPGGEYDIYVAIRDSEDGDAPTERVMNPRTGQSEEVPIAPNIVLTRERITVPDFWNDELQTSTIFLAEAIEPLTEAPTPEELSTFPYTIGTARITPKFDSSYATDDVLSFMFVIYNTGHDDGMPDVTVEYDFHQVTASGEEFFNRAPPQELNNSSLPDFFDVTQGFQLITGQQVPVGSFPAGDYRLEIKVTDKEDSNEISKDLLFTVEEG